MKFSFILAIFTLILSSGSTIYAKEQKSENTNMKNLKELKNNTEVPLMSSTILNSEFKKPYTSEDILGEGQDSIIIDGVSLRKGTIAAALKNADIIDDKNSSEEEIQAAYDSFKNNAENLILIGLHKHLVWKNEKIQKIIDDAHEKKNAISTK